MNDIVKLFGIPVAKVTEDEAVARIIAFAKQDATGKMPVVPVPQPETRNSEPETRNSEPRTRNL